MSFHGTDPKNIQSIIQNGFFVPGTQKGIDVANGSAYGVGIYSARTPSISLGYCRGGNQMFVCACLMCPEITDTKCAGDIIVQFKKEYIVPVFLVTFLKIDVVTNVIKKTPGEKKKNIFTVQYKQAKKLEKLRAKMAQDEQSDDDDESPSDETEGDSDENIEIIDNFTDLVIKDKIILSIE